MDSKNWKWIATIGSLAVARSLKGTMNTAYEKMTGKQAPVNVADRKTSFKDALLWTIALSVVAGLGKLVFDSLMAHKWKDDADTPEQLADNATRSTKELVTS